MCVESSDRNIKCHTDILSQAQGSRLRLDSLERPEKPEEPTAGQVSDMDGGSPVNTHPMNSSQ